MTSFHMLRVIFKIFKTRILNLYHVIDIYITNLALMGVILVKIV